MQRLVALLVLALVAGPQLSAAKKHGLIMGKGQMLGKGKGGDVNVDVQCQQACKDECYPIPQKVCNDVPYQTQACQKVPVTLTKQKCDRVCTTTTTTTEAVSSGKGKGMVMPVMSLGKGKGRHLLSKDSLIHKNKWLKGAAMGKGYMAAASYGKGAMPQVDTNCQDICNDVPYTVYQTQCKAITKTKTMCDIVYQQQCQKVCKPICQKVTTVTTTQTISTGKGMPVMMGKGKGM
ncbi:hypothetical protein OEZ85_003543 [Tetradesmus obliquus]|uniref:Uncharacterized protein n=1 Tax=Tetradesmus obliquus TaxID=3088 RepID=A0ABY8UC41_TETOB|nr:hypothetical protein OEZ85_003543 [Tetradesmus obliquus]